MIAGTPKKGNEAYFNRLKQAASASKRVILIPQFIGEEQTALLMSAADATVFNFRHILQSGSVALAQAYGKTVIAPRTGCLKELQGPNFHLFDRPEELPGLVQTIIADRSA